MEWIKPIAAGTAAIVMIVGLLLSFSHLKRLGQGFGPNSLRSIGIVLFIPTVILLAVTTDFKTETLATLLGTVAGYVLSNSGPNDK